MVDLNFNYFIFSVYNANKFIYCLDKYEDNKKLFTENKILNCIDYRDRANNDILLNDESEYKPFDWTYNTVNFISNEIEFSKFFDKISLDFDKISLDKEIYRILVKLIIMNFTVEIILFQNFLFKRMV